MNALSGFDAGEYANHRKRRAPRQGNLSIPELDSLYDITCTGYSASVDVSPEQEPPHRDVLPFRWQPAPSCILQIVVCMLLRCDGAGRQLAPRPRRPRHRLRRVRERDAVAPPGRRRGGHAARAPPAPRPGILAAQRRHPSHDGARDGSPDRTAVRLRDRAVTGALKGAATRRLARAKWRGGTFPSPGLAIGSGTLRRARAAGKCRSSCCIATTRLRPGCARAPSTASPTYPPGTHGSPSRRRGGRSARAASASATSRASW